MQETALSQVTAGEGFPVPLNMEKMVPAVRGGVGVRKFLKEHTSFLAREEQQSWQWRLSPKSQQEKPRTEDPSEVQGPGTLAARLRERAPASLGCLGLTGTYDWFHCDND